jgi:hypothetical protein
MIIKSLISFLHVCPKLMVFLPQKLKNKAHDGNITGEIERILNNVYKKLSTEVNTKIASELSAHLSEVNSTFTAELVRNNNELNKKLTGEIAKINSHDAGYASEAQKILSQDSIILKKLVIMILATFHLNSLQSRPLLKLSEMK